MTNDSLMFEKLHPTKLFFRCAIPAMLSMVFSALYVIIDGIFVGRFIGENALAAINLAMPLVNISFAVSDMVAVGSSVKIAIFLGGKNRDMANKVFSSSVKIIFAISIVTGIIFLTFTKPIFMMMGASGEALDYAYKYLCTYALFAPVTMIFFAVDNYLRICNRQKYSMILNISTALLNIFLDYLLIVVFDYKVLGAALASCVSIGIGSILVIMPFLRKKLELRLVRGFIPLKQFFHMLANGASEFFSNISGSIMAFILNIVLMDIGGTTAVAAMSIILYVGSIMTMLIFGMTDSMQPSISYCYGADLRKRLVELEKRVLFFGAILSGMAFLFLRYCGQVIVPFFVKPGDVELLELSIHAMRLYAFSYLVSWIYLCLSSYLTAMGKAAMSFVTSISGTLVFPLIWLAALVPFMGIDGVCLMPFFSGVLSSLLAIGLVVKNSKSQRIRE